jgi:urease accessory protein
MLPPAGHRWCNARVMNSMIAPHLLAHTGVHGAGGFAAGLAHPLLGLDHLLAMVAIGIWAARIGGHARWMVPAAFLATMFLGGLAGFTGLAVPLLEPAIAFTVLLLGLAISIALRPHPALPIAAAAAFALVHGNAHGLELPAAASPAAYTVGFLAATATLHLAGILLGEVLGRKSPALVRPLGLGIAAAGLVLLATHL